MATFSTIKLRDLRLGNVIVDTDRRFGRVYALEVAYSGAIHATYYYGTGDDVRTDKYIGEPEEMVLVADDASSIALTDDELYYGTNAETGVNA